VNQERLLGDAVWGVGLLRIAAPQIVFFERDGREFGIGTDRAEQHRFLDLTPARLLDHVSAHQEVRDVQLGGVPEVRADPPNASGEVDHHVRSNLREQFLHVTLVCEIVVTTARDDHIVRSPFGERATQRASNETGSPGHQKALAAPRIHFRIVTV
jgi:hypothetical protein